MRSSRQDTPREPGGIFVSYRRDDSAGHVGRLCDALISRFGAERVFVDIDHIEAGQDFVDVLHRAVAGCRVLLVVIGPRWLSASTAAGRRLDDPNDFVRLEVAAGLERNVVVIPILVHDATMPTAAQLPSALEKLARRQAFELSDHRWRQDVQALMQRIASIVKPPARSRSWMAAGAAVFAALALYLAVQRFGAESSSPADVPPTVSNVAAPSVSAPPPASNVAAEVPTPKPSVAAIPVLLDDDFTTTRRLGPQTRFNAQAAYCRTAYGPEGLVVEAVHASEPCEYVLYSFQAPVIEFRVTANIRLDHHPLDAKAYGLRLAEWRPPDPDSPFAYRGAVWGVDNFHVKESRGPRDTTIFSKEVESVVRAGERQWNSFTVAVNGRSMVWSLNGTRIATAQTRANVAGEISTYLEGQGLRVIFEQLQVVAGAR